MKALTQIIVLLILFSVCGVAGLTLIAFGLNYLYTFITDFMDTEWEDNVSVIAYTLLIIVLTLLIRWAFS